MKLVLLLLRKTASSADVRRVFLCMFVCGRACVRALVRVFFSNIRGHYRLKTIKRQ